jgi:hypothetical protein
MINPGTLPIEGSREDSAVANLDVFLSAVRTRALRAARRRCRHRQTAV